MYPAISYAFFQHPEIVPQLFLAGGQAHADAYQQRVAELNRRREEYRRAQAEIDLCAAALKKTKPELISSLDEATVHRLPKELLNIIATQAYGVELGIQDLQKQARPTIHDRIAEASTRFCGDKLRYVLAAGWALAYAGAGYLFFSCLPEFLQPRDFRS